MDFLRLFDIPQYQLEKYPQKTALAYRRKGVWSKYSTEKIIEHIDQFSAGLLRFGLQKGDTAAIMAHAGSPLWNIADLAFQQIGVIVVPIHSTIQPDELDFIFKDAGVKCCVVSNAEMLEKVRSGMGEELPVFSFEKLEGTTYTKEFLVEPNEDEKAKIEKIKAEISPDDLATIIYTSGTTGQPKGVCLSHSNIVSNIKSIMTLVPVDSSQNALSFLPLSHIFERMVTYLYMSAGTSIWYSDSAQNLFADAQEVKPQIVTAVPRVLEKFYQLTLEEARQQGKLSRRIANWAIRLAERFDPLEKLSPVFWLRHLFLDFMVYRRWRNALGGRLEGVVVGAAALSPRLARLLCAAGIPVREGYGLTESSPVVSFNHFEPGLYRFGTVGIPIPGVEVKIESLDESGEGEILVRGPNVMKGYFNRPEETKKVLSSDGWLRTGDIGKFVERRFLQITDRKRDIFKTSSGKFVAPQKIENHFRGSDSISQTMVMGLNRPHPAAFIVPNHGALEAWCKENGVHWTAPQFMVLNPKVVEYIQSEIDALNKELEPHERVRKFTLLHEEWTPENGALTFTMKINRKLLMQRFEKEIKNMYG